MNITNSNNENVSNYQQVAEDDLNIANSNNDIYKDLNISQVNRVFEDIPGENCAECSIQNNFFSIGNFKTDFLKTILRNPTFTRSAMNDLLVLLKKYKICDLPSDSWALLLTSRSYEIRKIKNGKNLYFRVKKQILNKLNSFTSSNNNDNLQLQINIDCLPIFNNSKTHLWPILGKLIGKS